MPLLDRDNNRTIETERLLPDVRASIQPRTYGELPAVSTVNERGLQPTRIPMETRSVGTLSDYAPSITYDRTLADTRAPIQARTMANRPIDSTAPVSSVSVQESLPLGQSVASYYSAGGGGGRAYDNPITVVPGGEESGSNSNLGLIFIVLAIAGGGAYWYYKKGGFSG